MTYVYKLTKQEISALQEKLSIYPMRFDVPYTVFQTKMDGCTLTAYQSGKIVLQGDEAAQVAALLGFEAAAPKPLPQQFPMAGSDEVGTGDYFGPVVVCACVVTQAHYDLLPISEIMDTKMMKDDDILRIAPQIMDVCEYSLLVVDNPTYNEIHKKHNLNTIKALLHNKAYVHLQKRDQLPKHAVIDQFMLESSYYKALAQEPEVVRSLTFVTKAENQYIAVACAAIIARFAFLKAFESFHETYNLVFPKGAGAQVDRFGVQLVAEFGHDILQKVAKIHFANTKRILP